MKLEMRQKSGKSGSSSVWRKHFPAAPRGLVRPARLADDFQPDDHVERHLGEGSAERIGGGWAQLVFLLDNGVEEGDFHGKYEN
jgi:hypothetical protein